MDGNSKLHFFRSECHSQVDLFAQRAVSPDCPGIGRAGNDRCIHHTPISDNVVALHVLIHVLILRWDVDE